MPAISFEAEAKNMIRIQKQKRGRHRAISLVKVSMKAKHVDILYHLLSMRPHAISHKSMPSLRQHKAFIASRPYRAWYLIKTADSYVGSIYVTNENSIGVSTIKGAEKNIPAAIMEIMRKHRPLPAIKSVRGANFDFNVAPSNKKLIAILKAMGASLVQVTYAFEKSAISG